MKPLVHNSLENAIEIAESIPFIEMITWNHEKLYEIIGQVVTNGVETVTEIEMPVFSKRRFQHGVASRDTFNKYFLEKEIDYRLEFLAIYE